MKSQKDQVNKIEKLLDKLTGRIDRSAVLRDLFELLALEISNRVDYVNGAKRSKRYDELKSTYRPDELKIMQDVGHIIFDICTAPTNDGEFGDWLGEIYMRSNTSSSQAGQFFTPYHLSQLSARLALAGGIDGKRDENGIITMNEPSCGSGGMIIAMLEQLAKAGVNYAMDAFVECNDIDRRCVHMCYVQLSLLGVPAVVKCQNTLTMEQATEVWFTPALMLQYWRFRKYIKKDDSICQDH